MKLSGTENLICPRCGVGEVTNPEGEKAMSKRITEISGEDLRAYFDVWFVSPYVQRMLSTTSLREIMLAAFEAGARGASPTFKRVGAGSQNFGEKSQAITSR
jgi:hypothetical protein